MCVGFWLLQLISTHTLKNHKEKYIFLKGSRKKQLSKITDTNAQSRQTLRYKLSAELLIDISLKIHQETKMDIWPYAYKHQEYVYVCTLFLCVWAKWRDILHMHIRHKPQSNTWNARAEAKMGLKQGVAGEHYFNKLNNTIFFLCSLVYQPLLCDLIWWHSIRTHAIIVSHRMRRTYTPLKFISCTRACKKIIWQSALATVCRSRVEVNKQQVNRANSTAWCIPKEKETGKSDQECRRWRI